MRATIGTPTDAGAVELHGDRYAPQSFRMRQNRRENSAERAEDIQHRQRILDDIDPDTAGRLEKTDDREPLAFRFPGRRMMLFQFAEQDFALFIQTDQFGAHAAEFKHPAKPVHQPCAAGVETVDPGNVDANDLLRSQIDGFKQLLRALRGIDCPVAGQRQGLSSGDRAVETERRRDNFIQECH